MIEHGSRAGAAMESFFSTSKTERMRRRWYASRNEARADVFDFIERFYDPRTSTFDARAGESGPTLRRLDQA